MQYAKVSNAETWKAMEQLKACLSRSGHPAETSPRTLLFPPATSPPMYMCARGSPRAHGGDVPLPAAPPYIAPSNADRRAGA